MCRAGEKRVIRDICLCCCQRRVFDTDGVYLKTLHAPNMHLTQEPILEVVPRGVRTATRTYPADVIVLATGFQTNNGLGPLRIQGRDGEWLDDHWRKMGGPGAYNGTAVHGCTHVSCIIMTSLETWCRSKLYDDLRTKLDDGVRVCYSCD